VRWAPLRMLNDAISAAPVDSANAFRGPRIAYSAELSVVTREFAHSRSRLEEISIVTAAMWQNFPHGSASRRGALCPATLRCPFPRNIVPRSRIKGRWPH